MVESPPCMLDLVKMYLWLCQEGYRSMYALKPGAPPWRAVLCVDLLDEQGCACESQCAQLDHTSPKSKAKSAVPRSCSSRFQKPQRCPEGTDRC